MDVFLKVQRGKQTFFHRAAGGIKIPASCPKNIGEHVPRGGRLASRSFTCEGDFLTQIGRDGHYSSVCVSESGDCPAFAGDRERRR